MLTVGVNLLYLRPEGVGGSEIYARKVIDELASLPDLSLRLYCTDEVAQSFNKSESVATEIVTAGSYSLRSRLLAENYHLPLSVRNGPSIDVIWSPGSSASLALPRITAQVITVHDLQHRWLKANFTLSKRLQRDALYYAAVRLGQHFIAVSDFSRHDLITRFNVNPAKVTTIYEGAETGPPLSQAETERHLKRLGLTTPYFLYPATDSPHKNHALAIRALGKMEADEPLSLVLTGRTSPSHAARLANIAEVAGVLGRVIHLGVLPRADFLTVLAGARGLVFPSKFEGFGLPIIEAQSCGVPVIASNVTAIPEIAGQGAVLLDPDDLLAWARNMTRVNSDIAWRERLVSQGRANAERFSWENCAAQTANVFRRVAGPSQRS